MMFSWCMSLQKTDCQTSSFTSYGRQVSTQGVSKQDTSERVKRHFFAKSPAVRLLVGRSPDKRHGFRPCLLCFSVTSVLVRAFVSIPVSRIKLSTAKRSQRHRRLSESLSVSLPASPSSAAGSDVHFALSPLTSQQPEPAVWKSPASSDPTPLADIAFVCYEDLSSPEEVKSPGGSAVAKHSLPGQQVSPKTSHKLPAETKKPRYKFFTSKTAHAVGTAGASKKTTVSPRQPLTDTADPAPEASPSGQVSTSRTSQCSQTPFQLQSRTDTSDHEKSPEEPDEATADDPPPASRRSGRTRRLSLPSYKEPSVNRKMRR
ncbi:uncharacterized protein ISCGN_023388 [Ixodes scapularis]